MENPLLEPSEAGRGPPSLKSHNSPNFHKKRTLCNTPTHGAQRKAYAAHERHITLFTNFTKVICSPSSAPPIPAHREPPGHNVRVGALSLPPDARGAPAPQLRLATGSAADRGIVDAPGRRRARGGNCAREKDTGTKPRGSRALYSAYVSVTRVRTRRSRA